MTSPITLRQITTDGFRIAAFEFEDAYDPGNIEIYTIEFQGNAFHTGQLSKYLTSFNLNEENVTIVNENENDTKYEIMTYVKNRLRQYGNNFINERDYEAP